MPFPADLTKINSQLSGALSFIQTYTRDTFPMFFSTQYLAPNAFHNVAGRLGYFPPNMGTSEAASILGVAFFKAHLATANTAYRDLGYKVADAFAGHFFLDDIYTTTNQGIDTPLVRNHWLVIAYGSVTTEGDQNGNDPFNFGTYASHTFTNGIAQLNSDLSKFYKAYDGILHYQNLFAPLRSGTEYPYDYYVRQGYKINSDGSQEATAEPDGRVVLQDTGFSGTLDCAYVRLNGSTLTAGGAPLTGANMAEPYPIFFKCKEGAREYTSMATDTVWWSYEMFDLAYNASLDSKYSNAREISKYNAIKYLINRKVETYYLKKEFSDNPLRYPGSYSLQFAVDVNGNSQALPGYTITRETSGVADKFIRLDINANSDPNIFSGVELQNFVAQTLIDPLVFISIEAASTVDQVLEVKVSLSPDSLDLTQEYKAYWKVNGDSSVQFKTLAYTSFMRYPSSSVWNIASAENPVFIYNSATYDFVQDTPLGIDTTVVSIIMPTAADGGGLINGNFTNEIPNIIYNLSGNATIRFQDDSSNYYYADIADTGGTWLTFTSSWAQLGVSDRLLTEIVFQNSDNNSATIKLFYVGDPPEVVPAPAMAYKAAVTDRDRTAHTLWVGDFRPNNNSLDNKQYKPGVIDFVLNTLNNAESGFYGEQYYCGYQSAYILDKWDLGNEVQNVLQLWTDAQESYRNQSTSKLRGLLHQVFLPYSPENIPYLEKLTVPRQVIGFPIPMIMRTFTEVPTDSYQFDSFSWEGLDPNTQWVNYNNRAMEDLARYFYVNQSDTKARKILVTYLDFIYEYYQNDPTTVITDIPPNVDPQDNYSEPHAAAIEGITALFANLGGIELDKTFWLMQNRFDYIDNQYVSTGAMSGSWTADQPTFIEGGTTYRENFSFWHGKIIEYYSELVLHQNEIRQSVTTALPVFPVIPGCSNNFAHYITEIAEAEYPILDQKYLAGNKQRILLSDSPVGKKIKLRFESLDHTNTETLITFYNTINQQYNGQFTFDNTKVDYADLEGTWVFEQTPTLDTKLANKDRGLFNIEIAIKQILLN